MWTGQISSSCGAGSPYSLDTSKTSSFTLTDDGNGGCKVQGTVYLVEANESGTCEPWTGPWACQGDVTPSGKMSLVCTCSDAMLAPATFQSGGELCGVGLFHGNLVQVLGETKETEPIHCSKICHHVRDFCTKQPQTKKNRSLMSMLSSQRKN